MLVTYIVNNKSFDAIIEKILPKDGQQQHIVSELTAEEGLRALNKSENKYSTTIATDDDWQIIFQEAIGNAGLQFQNNNSVLIIKPKSNEDFRNATLPEGPIRTAALVNLQTYNQQKQFYIRLDLSRGQTPTQTKVYWSFQH
ncbi:hypothetical protein [Chromobacterium subtsugae]|uniref:hypothetical protein n=1 Tax=Chromobacterium subtsugae TaxID=251747 RepID=UPI000A4BC5A6|nr:hypothetical protein [Chromobacterium subtsugae]